MSGAMRWSAVIARLVLGGVFVYAALPKIIDPVAFAGSVAAYRLLPYFGNYLTAATLPYLELVCGVLLLCGSRVRAATFLILLMNLAFFGALSWAIARGLDIDCGCFKAGVKTTPWVALLRDLIFLGLALFLLRVEAARPARRG